MYNTGIKTEGDKMFLKISGDRMVNLNNVSSVVFLENKHRIVFNLNYSVEIDTTNGKKIISDYVYWDGADVEAFKNNLTLLKSAEVFQKSFLSTVLETSWINVNAISSIKTDLRKNRVILNLNHPISFVDRKNVKHITSDFVYVECNNLETVKSYNEYLNEQLTFGGTQ